MGIITVVGKVVHTSYRDRPVSFFVKDEVDHIQRHHAQGVFYEHEELKIIEAYFERGSVFLDVGSNVGNHTIFVAKYLRPMQVILIEPNPPAIEVLRLNVELNRLGRVVDMSLLGLGLSDVGGWATAEAPPRNLGGARLTHSSDSHGIKLACGDDLLSGRRVDFIKMDVEGMEIRALSGLKRTIDINRPTLFIEVDDVNRGGIDKWIKSNDYVVEATFMRYKDNENLLAIPIERTLVAMKPTTDGLHG